MYAAARKSDPEGVLWITGLFRRLAAEGRTVLVPSHMLAARLVDALPTTAWETLADHGFGPAQQTVPPSVAASRLALAAWTLVGLGTAVVVTQRHDA